MKTTDSVMREKWEIEYDKLIHDVVDYPAAFIKVDGFECTPNEMKAFIRHSLAEARREWGEEMVKKIDKLQTQCNEADGLIDGATALHVLRSDLLKGDNPEEAR